MDSFRELIGLDNHYKLVATVSWLFGLAGDVWFIHQGAPYTFLLAFTSLVFIVPYGLKGLTAWLNRSGATSDAQTILTEVQAQITARRTTAGNDHEPTD
jgi:hypothetical protein